MLVSGAVELGMEGLKEFLFGFVILPSFSVTRVPGRYPVKVK